MSADQLTSRYAQLRAVRFSTGLLFEAALLIGLYFCYVALKSFTPDTREAVSHAFDVVELERALGVFAEQRIQQLFVDEVPFAVRWLNVLYMAGYLPLLGLTGILLYTFKRRTYYKYRDILLVSFGAALLIAYLYPLAPPRYFATWGFIDTLERFGPFGFLEGHDSVAYNRFAAMPSMHFTWGLLMSAAWVEALGRRAFPLAAAYLSAMGLALVVTGNHYFLDIAAAVPTLLGSAVVAKVAMRSFEGGRTLNEERAPTEVRWVTSRRRAE